MLKELWSHPTAKNEDDRELLEVLIEKWEREHSDHKESDPVQLIKFLMENHNMERAQMMEILDVNKGTLSKILSYKTGLSKNIIRRLSDHFKIAQEIFNKPYPLIAEANKENKEHKSKNPLNRPKKLKMVS